MSDSDAYLIKKAQFDQSLTVYGRKPVLEAIADPALEPQRLHLSKTNRPAEILEEISDWANKRKVEIRVHDAKALARISKNAKQDQGVALDVRCPAHLKLDDFLQNIPERFRLIALDGITNPQNLGMIIRSVAASPCEALLLSKSDNPKLSPLVIKASAGTLFRAPILRCEVLVDALTQLRNKGFSICVLDSNAEQDVGSLKSINRIVYVLGNETDGVSAAIRSIATHRLAIPMNRGIESLNVAVAAALVAFGEF